jgi:hypothetical protein
MVPLGKGSSSDRPIILADGRAGGLSRTVYSIRGQAFRTGSGHWRYGPSISRSEDRGSTFQQPVILDLNDLDNQLLDGKILSDGTLIVLFYDFEPRSRGYTRSRFLTKSRTWTVSSQDDGQTFSSPSLVVEHPTSLMAVDGSSNHRDRLYVTFSALAEKQQETWVLEPSPITSNVYVIYSDDRGERWSDPIKVNDNRKAGFKHDKPMIAVNREGVVGVAWYDRRNDPNNKCFDVYFSASMDGGLSWLPNVRVTEVTSCSDVAGNLVPQAEDKPFNVSARWPVGGDYSGIAAAPDGRFHVLWADSRTGLYQLWTAAISVGPGRTLPER